MQLKCKESDCAGDTEPYHYSSLQLESHKAMSKIITKHNMIYKLKAITYAFFCSTNIDRRRLHKMVLTFFCRQLATEFTLIFQVRIDNRYQEYYSFLRSCCTIKYIPCHLVKKKKNQII